MAYIKNIRSERSMEAINNFEMPLIKITGNMIACYLKSNKNKFQTKELEILRNIKPSKWIKQAKINKPSSWHHTGKNYWKTDHYKLENIATELLGIAFIEITLIKAGICHETKLMTINRYNKLIKEYDM